MTIEFVHGGNGASDGFGDSSSSAALNRRSLARFVAVDMVVRLGHRKCGDGAEEYDRRILHCEEADS